MNFGYWNVSISGPMNTEMTWAFGFGTTSSCIPSAGMQITPPLVNEWTIPLSSSQVTWLKLSCSAGITQDDCEVNQVSFKTCIDVNSTTTFIQTSTVPPTTTEVNTTAPNPYFCDNDNGICVRSGETASVNDTVRWVSFCCF